LKTASRFQIIIFFFNHSPPLFKQNEQSKQATNNQTNKQSKQNKQSKTTSKTNNKQGQQTRDNKQQTNEQNKTNSNKQQSTNKKQIRNSQTDPSPQAPTGQSGCILLLPCLLSVAIAIACLPFAVLLLLLLPVVACLLACFLLAVAVACCVAVAGVCYLLARFRSQASTSLAPLRSASLVIPKYHNHKAKKSQEKAKKKAGLEPAYG